MASSPGVGLEVRGLQYTASLVSAAAPYSVAAGNISGAYSVDLTGKDDSRVSATLTGNVTITITGLAASAVVRFFISQNGTGGYGVDVTDGIVSLPVSISTPAGATSAFEVSTTDGDEFIISGGGTTFAPQVKTADYTLAATDAGKIIEVNSTATKAITIPASGGFSVGDSVSVTRLNTGDVRFKAAAGVSLASLSNNRKVSGRYGRTSAYMRATNDWVLSGDLAAVSTFAPATDISSLVFWHDSSQLAFNDGDSITPLTDFSGAGNNGTQGTAANRATYHTGRINGFPSAVFDGVNDYYTVSALTALDATRTIWIVVAPDSTSPAHRGYGWSLTDQGHGIYLEAGSWKFGKNQAGTATTLGTASLLDIITVRFNSTGSVDAYINGAGLVNLDPDDAYQSTGGFSFTVGASANGDVASTFGGSIPGCLVSNDAVNDTVRANAETYLMAKWGKT